MVGDVELYFFIGYVFLCDFVCFDVWVFFDDDFLFVVGCGFYYGDFGFRVY